MLSLSDHKNLFHSVFPSPPTPPLPSSCPTGTRPAGWQPPKCLRHACQALLVAVQPDPENCGGQPGRGLGGRLVPRLCLCLLVVGFSLIHTFLFCHQPMAGALPAGDADETGGEADRPRLHLQLHPHLALAQRGEGGVTLLTRSFLQRSIRCAPTWQTSIRPVAL